MSVQYHLTDDFLKKKKASPLFFFLFYTSKFDMDTRHSQLVLISKRVEKANAKIDEILEKLNWTRTQLKQWQTVNGSC